MFDAGFLLEVESSGGNAPVGPGPDIQQRPGDHGRVQQTDLPPDVCLQFVQIPWLGGVASTL